MGMPEGTDRPVFAYELLQPCCPACGCFLSRCFPNTSAVNAAIVGVYLDAVCPCGWYGQALWARSQEMTHGTQAP